MRYSNNLLKEYNEKRDVFNKLCIKVKSVLYAEIKKKGIKIHNVEYRVKPYSSLSEKIIKKKVVNPFVDIHDIAGVRCVCFFRNDIDKIRKIIRNVFDVFEEDDKADDEKKDVFGYMSLHIKSKMKNNSINKSDTALIGLPFEIQVRTIAQDAWAAISHHLVYKRDSKGSLPKDLERNFNAISGLFYVADTHFSLLNRDTLNDKT